MCRPLDLISEGSQQSNKGPYIDYRVLVIGCFGTLVNKHSYSKDRKIGLLDSRAGGNKNASVWQTNYYSLQL